jgi:hypothetical protein
MIMMDDIFGQLPSLELPLPDGPDFSLDIDLNPKDIMELEEFDFDFEEINDLGSWIETSSDAVNDEDNIFVDSERLHFEDLEIKEAVRYDCMWASYNEFNAQKTRSSSISSNNVTNNSTEPTLSLSSSFYDSLLGSIDTPENSNSDCSSVKSEMETDEDEVASEKNVIKVNPVNCITSLDHCYNISSTQLDNERYLGKSGPLTPPVSSDDEEISSSSQTNLNFSSECRSNHNRSRNTTAKHKRLITTTNNNRTQNTTHSLLKRPVNRERKISEAKFSINLKVNLKNTDNSNTKVVQEKKKADQKPKQNKSSKEER